MLDQRRYQHVRVRVGDQEYQIPEYWLIGRSQVHACACGLDPRAAYRAAIDDWIGQAELEFAYYHQEERRPCEPPTD